MSLAELTVRLTVVVSIESLGLQTTDPSAEPIDYLCVAPHLIFAISHFNGDVDNVSHLQFNCVYIISFQAKEKVGSVIDDLQDKSMLMKNCVQR